MLTYEDAARMLKGARNGRRKLGNNTYLEARPVACPSCKILKYPCAAHSEIKTYMLDGRVESRRPATKEELGVLSVHYAVRLHRTDVVTLHPDGSQTLDSGGWRTVTTKDRINAHSMARVWSDRGEWKVAKWSGGAYGPSYDFADGVRIYPDGRVAGAGRDMSAVRRKVLAMIREYVGGYAESVKGVGLTEPSSGDCWGCAMDFAPADGRPAPPPGHGGMGVDHLLSHFEEKYYVPSLLWQALQRRGDPAFVWNRWNERAKRGDVEPIKGDLRAYFKPLMPALVEYVAGQNDKGAV